MIYHLALALMPIYDALNVFTYHTVRAGGAAFTAFLFCLVVGPWTIRMLRSLKIGQFIKKDHVADLHALHKGKAGTPTMGGVMMLGAAVFSLILWSTLTNRLLWLALGVFVLLGLVGFLDDYIKLKRKHNDGLSARAKLLGQILSGTIMGLYLVYNPITVSAAWVQERDVLDWHGLTTWLNYGSGEADTLAGRVWERLPDEGQDLLTSSGGLLPTIERERLLVALREPMNDPTLYTEVAWPSADLNEEAQGLLAMGAENWHERETVRFNRLVFESALPGVVASSIPNLHTRVGVPGFKDLFIPMGVGYVLFVIFIIVSMSNAVNLTDGLDGLAAGASMVSIVAFTAIAYIVSRADWSYYLYLTYVPEASELFVLGAALLGAGLGFLWFNAHPAEVFMGDTGSLSLGGAIATMGILTKQELLLPIVAGLFVLEIGSVVIQVASFKLTGRRVFRMAPLHHHFELLGWTETKVTLRFWIIAFLFAMPSLSTLKLR